MAHPTTVQLYLMDGTPSGRIKASLDNWVRKVYLIPRTEITRTAQDRAELRQTGIYLLFGTDADTGDQLLYVGQARERKNGKGILALAPAPQIRALAAASGAALVATMGGGAGIDRDPAFLGYIGSSGHRTAQEAIALADLTIVLGTSNRGGSFETLGQVLKR